MSDDKKVFTATNTGHGVHAKTSKKKEKVNIILKNTIGPQEEIKKVKIPVDTPIHKLKAKLAEIYGLDPNEFQLSHIPSKGKNAPGNPDQIKISSKKKPKSATDKSKAPVRIVLRDRSGKKKFQKNLAIPDSISLGELREEVSKKLGMDSDEFTLSLEKTL